MKGRSVGRNRVDDKHLHPVQSGEITEHTLHSRAEATRILAREQQWSFVSYLVCDDRGPIAYCLEDLADFAEDLGWIYYDSSSFGFGVDWSRIPRPAAVAADKARWALDGLASIALDKTSPAVMLGTSSQGHSADTPSAS
jgi:hypothetical protein